VRQGVASAQRRVAPSTTEQAFEPATPQASRQKGRDGASFGQVLEGLKGQTVAIGAFMGRYLFFVCVFGARIAWDCESLGNAIAECHCSQ
jgi:hypothetical protein